MNTNVRYYLHTVAAKNDRPPLETHFVSRFFKTKLSTLFYTCAVGRPLFVLILKKFSDQYYMLFEFYWKCNQKKDNFIFEKIERPFTIWTILARTFEWWNIFLFQLMCIYIFLNSFVRSFTRNSMFISDVLIYFEKAPRTHEYSIDMRENVSKKFLKVIVNARSLLICLFQELMSKKWSVSTKQQSGSAVWQAVEEKEKQQFVWIDLSNASWNVIEGKHHAL